MNPLSEVEGKSFRTFTFFTFIVLIILGLVVPVFSSKYRVSIINYDTELNLNYEGLKQIENSSIWLINDDNFEKFYLDNKSVEKLEISKQLPNIINININLHQKIIVYTDFRDSSPKQRVLYKNLYTDDKIFEFSISKAFDNPMKPKLLYSSSDKITLEAEGFKILIKGIGKSRNALKCSSNSFIF